MKKRTKRLLVLCALLVVAAITVTAIALPTATQENPQGEKSPWFIQPATGAEGYVPPHNPYDTPEAWKALSVDTRNNLALIQIPEELLANMSAIQLVKSGLNYIYNLDMWVVADDWEIDRFMAVRNFFNGYGELLSRPDCGVAALTVFQNIALNDLLQHDALARLRFEALRALLWQQEIIDSMTTEQKIQTILLDRDFLSQINADHILHENYIGAVRPDGILAARYLASFDQEFQAQVESNENLKNFINFKNFDSFLIIESNEMVDISEYVDRKYGEQA